MLECCKIWSEPSAANFRPKPTLGANGLYAPSARILQGKADTWSCSHERGSKLSKRPPCASQRSSILTRYRSPTCAKYTTHLEANRVRVRKQRYHNRNFYRKVEAMQQEYLSHQNSGRTEMYIYRKWIYPRFFISRATFYNWLSINPTRELEKLKVREPGLFDNQNP